MKRCIVFQTKTLLITAALLLTQGWIAADADDPPRLVLQITVDQLRGDLPRRYADRFTEGGFRYLLEHGTVYLDAHHRHANTETIVGHTTLATGADPAAHGMVANVWLDRASEQLRYNVEDANYPLITDPDGFGSSTELDPTLRVARTNGRSPRSILVSTFSDELTLFTGRRSKCFAVSVKDRGAISMAGHSGKAFWFSKHSGGFVTSRFYYKQLPDWVIQWNRKELASRYAGKSWELTLDRSRYVFGDQDDRPFETLLPGFGRTFPHAYGSRESELFTSLLTASPAGDDLTLDFAKTLIAKENLGVDEITDYLSISFSSTDYVGHLFGPSSLESEDNLLRLDRSLAELFRFVEETIGLDKTLIVLSADHGGSEAPGYLRQLGFDADYVHPKTWDTSKAIESLKKRFEIGEDLITAFYQPYIYLNRSLIREKGLDQAEVERAVAEELTRFDGIALAVPSSALSGGNVPETRVIKSILRNYSPKRSGDVYIVFEPNCFINDFDGLTVATTHGSPWRYDTYVPLIFAGSGIPTQRIARPVETVDVAPTLSILVGAKPPSGSVGVVLEELLKE